MIQKFETNTSQMRSERPKTDRRASFIVLRDKNNMAITLISPLKTHCANTLWHALQ